jgi:hypothetical protein
VGLLLEADVIEHHLQGQWERLSLLTDSKAGLFRGGCDYSPVEKLLESMQCARPSAGSWVQSGFFELGTSHLKAQSLSSDFVLV